MIWIWKRRKRVARKRLRKQLVYSTPSRIPCRLTPVLRTLSILLPTFWTSRPMSCTILLLWTRFVLLLLLHLHPHLLPNSRREERESRFSPIPSNLHLCSTRFHLCHHSRPQSHLFLVLHPCLLLPALGTRTWEHCCCLCLCWHPPMPSFQ